MNWFWNWLEKLVTKRKRKQLEKIYDSLKEDRWENLESIAEIDDEIENDIEEEYREEDEIKQDVEEDHSQHFGGNPVNFERTDMELDIVSEDYYKKEYEGVPDVNVIVLDDENIPTPDEIFEVFFEEILDCKTDVEVAMVLQELFNEIAYDVKRGFIRENIKFYAKMHKEMNGEI